MATAEVRLPDGRTATLSVPEGATNEQIARATKSLYEQGKFDNVAPPKTEEDSLTKLGQSAGGLNDSRDITEIDPFAISEAGLDVGTDKSKTGAMRQVAQGLSLGTADEIEAALKSVLGGESFGDELSKISKDMKSYKDSKGGEATLQELIGAVMSPAGFMKLPKYMAQYSPALQSAIKGLIGGTTYGFASAEGGVVDRGEEGLLTGGVGFLFGGTLGKMADALGNVKLSNMAKSQSVSPTVEGLKKLRDTAYEAVDSKQLIIGAKDSADLLRRASEVANSHDYVTLKGAPTVVDRVQKMLESKAGQGLTLGQAENLRRSLFKFTDDKQYGKIVRDIIGELDGLVDNKLAASGDDALRLAREAHQNYAKANTFERAFQKAGNKVSGSTYNKYRSAVSSILNNPKEMKYFSDAEKETMKKFIDGTLPQKTMDFIGRWAPNASGLSMALHVASGVVNPWLVLASVASQGAKLGADASIIRKSQKLVKELGGVEEVRKMADKPTTASLKGFTANEIRESYLGPPEEQ